MRFDAATVSRTLAISSSVRVLRSARTRRMFSKYTSSYRDDTLKMDRAAIARQITESDIEIPDLPLKPYIEALFLTSWAPVFEIAKRRGILRMLCIADHNIGRKRPTDIALTFAAFHATPFDTVRVVILGQDPYPGQASSGQEHATGMSFAVARGVLPLPISLVNVLNEAGIPRDNKIRTQISDLTPWAAQGVFLLNASLTLYDGSDQPTTIWTPLIELVLSEIASRRPDAVYFLWGKKAQAYGNVIKRSNGGAMIFATGHPSSRNHGPEQFKDCGHFEKANMYFHGIGQPMIQWDAGIVSEDAV